MHGTTKTLTEREKETLRLLLAGHDAKSVARQLGLSVHTINERLRDARRKLGVSSSREAARLLAAADDPAPDFAADKLLGVPAVDGTMPFSAPASPPRGAGQRLAWFGGGMIVMSLFIAAIALSSVVHGAGENGSAAPARAPAEASAARSLPGARQWLALLDRQAWDESWREAAALFKAQVGASQWSAMVQSVRQPLGRVSARNLQSVTPTTTLPGVPAGDYEVLQFGTDFANKRGAIETVSLAREAGGWKVVGYFIR